MFRALRRLIIRKFGGDIYNAMYSTKIFLKCVYCFFRMLCLYFDISNMLLHLHSIYLVAMFLALFLKA